MWNLRQHKEVELSELCCLEQKSCYISQPYLLLSFLLLTFKIDYFRFKVSWNLWQKVNRTQGAGDIQKNENVFF